MGTHRIGLYSTYCFRWWSWSLNRRSTMHEDVAGAAVCSCVRVQHVRSSWTSAARSGRDVRLSCLVIGPGTLRYRWTLPSGSSADGSSKVAVERVSDADLGHYICQVNSDHWSDTIYYDLLPISARLFLSLSISLAPSGAPPSRCFVLPASPPLPHTHTLDRVHFFWFADKPASQQLMRGRVTSTSIELKWLLGANGGAPVTSFRVHYAARSELRRERRHLSASTAWRAFSLPDALARSFVLTRSTAHRLERCRRQRASRALRDVSWLS